MYFKCHESYCIHDVYFVYLVEAFITLIENFVYFLSPFLACC